MSTSVSLSMPLSLSVSVSMSTVGAASKLWAKEPFTLRGEMAHTLITTELINAVSRSKYSGGCYPLLLSF